MSYNAKNYTEQGGEVTHIGGKLIIEEGAVVEGLEAGGGSYTLPIASPDTLGGVKGKTKSNDTVEVVVDEEGRLYVPAYPKVPQMEKQEDSVAEDVGGLATDFNALLAKLRESGLMKSE